MRVYVDQQVYDVMEQFYDISMRIHPTLDYETVIAKIDRLEHALEDFANYAELLHKKPYRKDWRDAGYFEYTVERFHFAYKVYQLPTGEKVLYFYDAVHETLNYNPEDAE